MTGVQTCALPIYLDLWGSTVRRMAGEQAAPAIEPSPRDKRFKDPEWKSNQFFDFVLQLYLLTTQWAQELVKNADGVDPHTRKKAEFYVQQITNAIAPSNFVFTNPEVLRETLASNGDNLVRGMKMLAEDIEAGHGTLRIRQSDPSNLVVGVNMATTPGKVIFQNELMQLIQYTPTTETVLRTPLLIVPPWINKFYILDLKPEKSYIKWCVDQGITVFVISWVNPDKELGKKTFDDYMKQGPLTAMDVIEKVTGEMKVHTAGYCVGGTLLASTLAWLAEKRRQRVTSATFFAAQVDFTHAGDLLVFVDEDQISALERDMQSTGVLEGSKMAMAFNMLRSNDLIWSYVVSNYLKGQPPSSFDRAAKELRAVEHRLRGRDVVLAGRQIVHRHPHLRQVEQGVVQHHAAGGQPVLQVAVAQIVGMVRRRHPRRIGIPVQQIERGGRLSLQVIADDVGPDQVVRAQHVEGHRHLAAFEHTGGLHIALQRGNLVFIDEHQEVAGMGEVDLGGKEGCGRHANPALFRQPRQRRGEQGAADAIAGGVNLHLTGHPFDDVHRRERALLHVVFEGLLAERLVRVDP